MQRRNGFTLIELLVVIAIIAILAAILFPVFIRAKAQAAQTKCLGNLKQIGFATALYMDDNGSRFPVWWSPSSRGYGWFYSVQKYARTKVVCKCPGDIYKASDYPVSYWKNSYTDYWSGEQTSVAPPLLSGMVRQTSIVYIMDGPPQMDGAHTWWGPPRTWNGWGAQYQRLCADSEKRHNGGAAVLFIDWHVKIVRPYDFKTSFTGTAASCPLLNLPAHSPSYYPHSYTGGAIYEERGDGHPWFRGD